MAENFMGLRLNERNENQYFNKMFEVNMDLCIRKYEKYFPTLACGGSLEALF